MTIPSRMRNYPVLVFSMGAGCLLSFVIAMAFLLFRRSLSFATVLRDGVVAMAVVLLVAALALPVENPVLYIGGSAIQLAVSIMLWISGISFMHERSVSFARVQSAIRLFLYIGVLGASMAWPTLQRCDAGITLLVLTVVLLGVTVSALGCIVDADHLHSSVSVVDAKVCTAVTEASRPNEPDARGFSRPQPTASDERQRRIEQVAERFGLSPREQEVFSLLSPWHVNRMCALTLLAPVTSTDNGYSLHVPIAEDSPVYGFVQCEAIRSIDLNARAQVGAVEVVGSVDDKTLADVMARVLVMLGLEEL